MEELGTDDTIQDKNEVMIFQVHLQSIFREISTGVSLETFKQLFGDIIKNRSSLIEKLHAVFVQELYNDMMGEMQLQEFVIEENLDEKFSKRAKLTKDSTLEADAVAWRPKTGEIDQQLRSHDMDALLKYKQELEDSVTVKEACVEHLKTKVLSLRSKIRKLNADIAASRRLKEESILTARRVRDNMLSAWLENTQNAKRQLRREQELS